MAPRFLYLLLASLLVSVAGAELFEPPPLVLQYHNGLLLSGNYTLHLVWYGRFTLAQRAVVTDFVRSLAPIADQKPPSVASWWRTTARYGGAAAKISLGRQILDEGCSLGKSLAAADILALVSRGPHRSAVTAVITAADVAVEGFCVSRCGTHSSGRAGNRARFPYIWVGESSAQCPGQCAWPFHQPLYGPQTPPLTPPNGDVGMDGAVINLATLLAGAATNPYGNGYFQGPATAPLEAVTACTGAFGSGSYPGYPGSTLVDPPTGASYNAHGSYGRKYLLPAMWDPKTSQCSTLV